MSTHRRYVVTGAASGIGASVAELLRSQGHEVIGIDLKDGDLTGDLGDATARRALVTTVSDRCRWIDGLITCAGVRAAGPATVSVNFFGTVELAEGLRPLLAGSDAPRVVATSSLASVLPWDDEIVEACLAGDEPRAREAVERSAPDDTGRPRIYSSSKTAVSRWVRRVATAPEWAGAGILLNAVAPGSTATPMMADVLASQEAQRQWLEFLPNSQDRFPEPIEVARVMTWLASAENSLLVGQTVFADLGTEPTLRGDATW
ncbi:MAG: family oxidoreductase [Nocardioidaceae bacterium]|nr:family oxidoreductase [Nocardioidaceae bacterium]